MASRAAVAAENDYSYTDKFNGRRRTFEPKDDEVVATFANHATEETTREVMRASSLSISRGANLERGFAVFRVGSNRELNEAVSALDDQPQIANSLPVMVDEDGLVRYFLPDELTVQFADGVDKSEAERIIASKGSTVLVEQRTPGYYTISVPTGKGLFETIEEFAKLGEVAFAEPSEAGFDDALAYFPDDTDFPKLWGLHNTGQAVNGVSGTPDADIDATEAWTITRGHPDVVVAVIDTGADLDHPDLKPNLFPRGAEDWDFADEGDPVPEDGDSHGTHVAGTAVGADNSGGVIGVAPLCRLMPLRVNLTSGMNQNRADAINYVAGQAAANPQLKFVINCSWKMNGDHAGVHNAIINAVNKNVVVVFAAGNANTNIDATPQFPAVYPEVIAVAATDQKDKRAGFSNFGTKVDVSAPGVNTFSSVPDNTFGLKDGTSMAAPHVAGLAALIRSRNRTLTNAQVRTIVEGTCDDINAKNPGFEGRLGKGRINAFKALSATPPAPIAFKLVRKLPFPQKNDGSSSALGFAPKIFVGFLVRPALIFLTQQPFSEKVHFMNPMTGGVLRSIDPQDNDTIGSLEWIDGKLLVANVTTGSGSINTINAATGAMIGSIPAPAGRGEGMAFDGEFLYYSTITRIHVIRPSTGAVVRSFPPPGGACKSLAFGLGHLFSGGQSGTITVFDPLTLAVRGTIAAPGAGSEKAEGLAFNPSTNELFVANQSENTIYVGQVAL